jgi:hypothetical protein
MQEVKAKGKSLFSLVKHLLIFAHNEAQQEFNLTYHEQMN